MVPDCAASRKLLLSLGIQKSVYPGGMTVVLRFAPPYLSA